MVQLMRCHQCVIAHRGNGKSPPPPPGSTVVTQYICVHRWHSENRLYFGRVIDRPRASATSSVIAILTIWMEKCQSGYFLQISRLHTNEQETRLTTAHLKQTETKPLLMVFSWIVMVDRHDLSCLWFVFCAPWGFRSKVVEFLDPFFSGFICPTRPTDPGVNCQIIQPARPGMAAAAVHICNCRKASELKWF